MDRRRLMNEDKIGEYRKEKIIADKTCTNMGDVAMLFSKYAESGFTIFVAEKLPNTDTLNNQFLSCTFVNGIMHTAIRYRNGVIGASGTASTYDGIINVGDVYFKFVH